MPYIEIAQSREHKGFSKPTIADNIAQSWRYVNSALK